MILPNMNSSAPVSTPIETSSTSVAGPLHTEPDSLRTVVTLPSVVIVPAQVPSPSAASSRLSQAIDEKTMTDTTTATLTFIEGRG